MTIEISSAPMLRMIWPGRAEEIDLTPLEGLWTEEQYLTLTDRSRVLIEFTDGSFEVLPMPTDNHQMVLRFIFLALMGFVEPFGGRVLFAALRLKIRSDKFREPDVMLVLDKNDPRRQNRYWLGADLVVEIVSEDNPERDTVEKVADYAEAGIPEYWIVNPLDQTITVLTLVEGAYVTHGSFRRGEQAVSLLLDGFSVAVDAVFEAQ